MIKQIIVFQLARGSNREKVWEHWANVHSRLAKTIPGIKKMVINRVTTTLPGPGAVKRDVNFWGLAELWFDSKADYDQAMSAFNELFNIGEFMELAGEPPRLAFVEEKVIKG